MRKNQKIFIVTDECQEIASHRRYFKKFREEAVKPTMDRGFPLIIRYFFQRKRSFPEQENSGQDYGSFSRWKTSGKQSLHPEKFCTHLLLTDVFEAGSIRYRKIPGVDI